MICEFRLAKRSPFAGHIFNLIINVVTVHKCRAERQSLNLNSLTASLSVSVDITRDEFDHMRLYVTRDRMDRSGIGMDRPYSSRDSAAKRSSYAAAAACSNKGCGRPRPRPGELQIVQDLS